MRFHDHRRFSDIFRALSSVNEFGLIMRSISLPVRRNCGSIMSFVVATEDIHLGTGHLTETPLVSVASDRDTFTGLNLANVVPLATLAYLKASVSKNPFGLVPIDLSKGVRG